MASGAQGGVVVVIVGLGESGSGGVGHGGLKGFEERPPGTVVETGVADLVEAAGQDVLEESAQELLGWESECSGLVGVGVAVTQADLGVVVAQDGALRDGDPVEVAGQIGEGGVAGADGLGVDDPVVMAPCGGMDLCVDIGMVVAQRVAEPCAEDLGEGLNGNQELRVCVDPVAARGQSAAGDDEVHVGVIGDFGPVTGLQGGAVRW